MCPLNLAYYGYMGYWIITFYDDVTGFTVTPFDAQYQCLMCDFMVFVLDDESGIWRDSGEERHTGRRTVQHSSWDVLTSFQVCFVDHGFLVMPPVVMSLWAIQNVWSSLEACNKSGSQ